MNIIPSNGSYKVVFRVDASLTMGTGHVMRCLTLADEMSRKGAECHFLCREHPGNLIEEICARGYQVHTLPINREKIFSDEELALGHAGWLGANWQDDARQSREIIDHLLPGWLVVDHYSLDRRWEQRVLTKKCRLLVIDDLADRNHCADILLDQNLGRNINDYDDLVPDSCTRLIGPRYSLLRPEFLRLRKKSLNRRLNPRVKNLLVTMGGVDKDNATGKVLEALASCDLPKEFRTSVIMGKNSPWLAQVKVQAASMPRLTEVLVNVTDMAERMSQADLAIGAAGSTSWERCCLGLPTLMVVLAKNQRETASILHSKKLAINLGEAEKIVNNLPRVLNILFSNPSEISLMSSMSARICDGSGANRVLEEIKL